MNIIDKIVENFVKATYNKIEVKSGNCRFNQKCHLNSVHEALNNNEDKLAMAYCHSEKYDDYFVHFINVNNDGEFIDNTLGRWSEIYEYYFIRYINKSDYFDIDSIFNAYNKEMLRRLPFYIRWFHNGNF